MPIFGKQFSWIEYSRHGELALYSAAFLAPTLRLIGKDVDDNVFVRRQSFLFFGWIFLTAAVALYSGVISAAQMPPNTVQVDTRLLFGFSAFLFVVSVIFSSVVRLIDFQRIQSGQIFAVQHASEARLEVEFEKTGPQSKEPFSSSIVRAVDQQSATSESPTAAPAHSSNQPEADFNGNEGPDDGTSEN